MTEDQTPTRRPPTSVRRALCQEVGFRCPVEECGSPYLTFHHFDPPWRHKRHHDAAGMIALCSNHAAKADQHYYPDDYLQRLKREGLGRARSVEGEFDYLRRDLLVIVGSNAYYNVETILQIGVNRAIFFNRDPDGYLLLNFQLPAADGNPRAWMEDNVWIVPPGAANIECPPRGRYLAVQFENGDRFRIQYTEVANIEEYAAKFPKHDSLAELMIFPLSVAEFWETSVGAGIELGRGATRIGSNVIRDNTIAHSRVGIMMDAPAPIALVLPERYRQTIAAAIDNFNSGRA
jgi:hypothetical protein